MKAGQKPADKPVEKVEAKTEAVKDGRPDPDKFSTVGEYYEAVAEWKFDQKQQALEKSRQVEKAKTEQQSAVSKFQDRVKEFSKTATDMQDVLEAVDHIPVSPAMQDIFVNSENGHELMYELAKDPEEYERINKLSPLAAAREIGKREAKLSAASKSGETTIETKTTKAPPPVKPVSGKSTSASTKDPGDMNFQEYKAWYEKQYGAEKRG